LIIIKFWLENRDFSCDKMFYNKEPTMNQKLISAKHIADVYLHNFSTHWKINWHKYVVILFIGFIIYNKDLNFQLQLKNSNYSNLIPQLNMDFFFKKIYFSIK
jgi:hypothetical protein